MADNNATQAPSHPLERPTLADAYTALERMYGPHLGDTWRTLLFRSGLTGEETDLDSFHRLVNCMCTAGSITSICGRSLQLRAATYTRLSAQRTEGTKA